MTYLHLYLWGREVVYILLEDGTLDQCFHSFCTRYASVCVCVCVRVCVCVCVCVHTHTHTHTVCTSNYEQDISECVHTHTHTHTHTQANTRTQYAHLTCSEIVLHTLNMHKRILHTYWIQYV